MTWKLPYELPGGTVTVEPVREQRMGPWPVRCDRDRLERPLLVGGWVRCDRVTRRAVLATPHVLSEGEFAHPYASAVAAPFAVWDGLDALHGGALVIGGRAVVLLGGRTAGKSTLLAHAATEGLPILADDLVVLFEECGQVRAAAGPRTVDLRPASARWLEAEARSVGRELAFATSERDGRHRLRLEPAASSVPLAGFVLLTPGERVSVHDVRPSDALGLLTGHRSLPMLLPDPGSWFRTAAHPLVRVTRPLDLGALPEMLDVLRALPFVTHTS